MRRNDHEDGAALLHETGDPLGHPPGGGYSILREIQADRDGVTAGDYLATPRVIDPPRGLLARFSRLNGSAGIAAFAGTYGLLGLCEHGLPARHAPGCSALDHETYDAWREHAEVVGAVGRLALVLRTHGDRRVDDWRIVGAMANRWRNIGGLKRQKTTGPHGVITRPADTTSAMLDRYIEDTVGDAATERRALALFVRDWWTLASVTALPSWSGERASLLYFGVGLFGALGIQMFGALNGAETTRGCVICGDLLPKGARKYCELHAEEAEKRAREKYQNSPHGKRVRRKRDKRNG